MVKLTLFLGNEEHVIPFYCCGGGVWVSEGGSGSKCLSLLPTHRPVSGYSYQVTCALYILGGLVVLPLMSKRPVSQVFTPEHLRQYPPLLSSPLPWIALQSQSISTL